MKRPNCRNRSLRRKYNLQVLLGESAMQNGILLSLCLIALNCDSAVAQNNSYNSRAVNCPGSNVRGYNTINALQQDINQERSRVVQGGSPANSYQFTLCPNTNFQVTEPLVPGLDNIQIGCGSPPLRSNNCAFTGGDVQVDVQDFLQTSHPVSSVQIQGVRFANFNQAAISGSASENTEVAISDTRFDPNQSTNVIRQESPEGSRRQPFSVSIFGAELSGSTTEAAFQNENGEIVIREMSTTRFSSPTVVAANGNPASVFIEDMEVSSSQIGNVVNLSEGADGIINGIRVVDNPSIGRVVRTFGQGTQARIRSSEISGNLNDEPWRAIEAIDESSVIIEGLTMENNENLEHQIAATFGSTISVIDLLIDSSTGSLGTSNSASSIIFASSDSVISLSDATLRGVSDITTGIFVYDQSDVQTTRVCIDSITADGIVFVQDGSDVSVREDNAVMSSPTNQCPTDGERLIQEPPGAGCFDPDNTNPCDNLQCENFADFNNCTLIPLVNITLLPTTSPTNEPTLSPTQTLRPTASKAPSSTPILDESDFPSVVPTITPPPTSSTPTISSAPTGTPSSSSPPSIPPTIAASTLPTITVQPSSQPSGVTPGPTRCKERPSKGKGKGKGKGYRQLNYAATYYVYHYVHIDDGIPWCPTPAPIQPGKGFLPNTKGKGFAPTLSKGGKGTSPGTKGKGYYPQTQGKGFYPQTKGKGYYPQTKGKGFSPITKGKGSAKGYSYRRSPSSYGKKRKLVPENEILLDHER